MGYIDAVISEEKNPETAKKIIEALPIESKVRKWGDEIYFDIPVYMGEENGQIEVEVGALAYWPSGNCFCIFYGRTPASSGELPVAASHVNVFGKIDGDIAVLRKVKNGELIKIEEAASL